MSNQPANRNQSDEIDLSNLFSSFRNLFRKIVKTLFLILAFFYKYIIITVILLIVGFAYGFYKDKSELKVYANETIVIPNFESVDYLYGTVDALNEKIALADQPFLEAILDTNYHKINHIQIEPIVDIYNFVTKSRENIDVFRVLFQNQDLTDFIEDMATSKYYKYHKLDLNIVGTESAEKITLDILNYLNSNEHYKKYQEVSRENTRFQIKQHENLIAQVDSLLRGSAGSLRNTSGTGQNVFINDYSEINDVLETKQELLDNLLFLKKKEKDEDEIIKLVNANYNVIPEKSFYISNKVKYPLLLILIFSTIFFVPYVYKKMKIIAEDN